MGESNYRIIRSVIPKKINLVTVVKSASLNQIKEILNNGCKDLGFNTFQQFEKVTREIHPVGIRTHFIGHIQSNKLKKILELKPTLIQSVDSVKLLENMNERCSKVFWKQNILLQVKTDEKKDYGFNMEDIFSVASLIHNRFTNLNLKGLMTIPERENSAESFFKMSNLFHKLKRNFSDIEFLSMGMSEDYGLAIKNGSNMVRIGRGIFSNSNLHQHHQ